MQIVWSNRRGSRQIEHLGSAHDERELEALKAAAAARLSEGQPELDLGLAGAPGSGPTPATADTATSPPRSRTPLPLRQPSTSRRPQRLQLTLVVRRRWLALLLLRVAENATGDTRRNIRHELERLHLVTLATTDGQVAQRCTLTAGHKAILAALELPEPPRFFDFTVTTD